MRSPLVLLLVAACGGEPVTLGAFCEQRASAVCNQLEDVCGYDVDQAACRAADRQACCAAAGTCDDDGARDWYECVTDVAVHSCHLLHAPADPNHLPESCEP